MRDSRIRLVPRLRPPRWGISPGLPVELTYACLPQPGGDRINELATGSQLKLVAGKVAWVVTCGGLGIGPRPQQALAVAREGAKGFAVPAERPISQPRGMSAAEIAGPVAGAAYPIASSVQHPDSR